MKWLTHQGMLAFTFWFTIPFTISLPFTFYIQFNSNRSSHRRCSLRKGVLRNFAKFAGKHLFQSLFLIRLLAWGLQLCWDFIGVFLLFLGNFYEHLFYRTSLGDCFYNKLTARLKIYHKAVLFKTFCLHETLIRNSIRIIYSSMLCVCVYVHPPWRLHLSGVGSPGYRSTMLCWRRFFPLPSSFIDTSVWITKPF